MLVSPPTLDVPPDPSGPSRIAQEIVATLSALPFVQEIALFGSLAEERADCWSDVDIWVACEDVEQTQWVAAAAIRAAHPVLFYRMFSNVPQPLGRYWFEQESPFHNIDISFHSLTRYAALVKEPILLGHPVTLRRVFIRSEAATQVELPSPCHPADISAYEQELGACIYLLLRAMRLYQRGQWEWDVVEERHQTLKATLGDHDRSCVLGGGAIGELAYRMLDIIERVRTDRRTA